MGVFFEKLPQTACVIGGIAVNSHGFARFTADIDVCVAAGIDDLKGLVAIARTCGFRLRAPDGERFAQENYLLMLVHAETGIDVDLSLGMQAFEVEVTARPQDAKALLQVGKSINVPLIEHYLSEFDSILDVNRHGEWRQILRDFNAQR